MESSESTATKEGKSVRYRGRVTLQNIGSRLDHGKIVDLGIIDLGTVIVKATGSTYEEKKVAGMRGLSDRLAQLIKSGQLKIELTRIIDDDTETDDTALKVLSLLKKVAPISGGGKLVEAGQQIVKGEQQEEERGMLEFAKSEEEDR